MKVTINKKQIVELYSVGEKKFIYSKNDYWHKWHSKGEKILYLFPRFGRPKYYESDTYYNDVFGKYDCTLEELNHYIESSYKSEIESGTLYKKDGEYYYSSYVKIVMSNNAIHRIIMRTYDECETYIKNLRESENSLVEINDEN